MSEPSGLIKLKSSYEAMIEDARRDYEAKVILRREAGVALYSVARAFVVENVPDIESLLPETGELIEWDVPPSKFHNRAQPKQFWVGETRTEGEYEVRVALNVRGLLLHATGRAGPVTLRGGVKFWEDNLGQLKVEHGISWRDVVSYFGPIVVDYLEAPPDA